MPVNKKHAEFHAVELGSGWEVPPGYPAGIEQKILSGALDEAGKRGSRTRLLAIALAVEQLLRKRTKAPLRRKGGA